MMSVNRLEYLNRPRGFFDCCRCLIGINFDVESHRSVKHTKKIWGTWPRVSRNLGPWTLDCRLPSCSFILKIVSNVNPALCSN